MISLYFIVLNKEKHLCEVFFLRTVAIKGGSKDVARVRNDSNKPILTNLCKF